MWSKILLYLCVFATIERSQGQNALPPNSQGAELNAGVVSTASTQRLVRNPACSGDIAKYCAKRLSELGVERFDDNAALFCLQDGAYSEVSQVESACGQAIWEYKVYLTQDPNIVREIAQFCADEINSMPAIRACTQETRPGYALSCMMEHAHEIKENTQCFKFLVTKEQLAFSDFRLVAPFVEYCANAIAELKCGSLAKPSAHQSAILPHTQGATAQCLMRKLSEVAANEAEKAALGRVSDECRRQTLRIAELQSQDFHLNRPLYFACRQARERFCSQVPAGGYQVFQCLVEHKDSQEMEPECVKRVAEYEGMMGQDYRLAHSLTKACAVEMGAYRCIPQPGFEKSLHFHLSWVLLCLENGLHFYKQQLTEKELARQKKIQPFTNDCQHEMFQHRQMMVSEFRMNPEVVMSCAKEISEHCSPGHDLENEGKTLHCLMRLAQEREDNKMGSQCHASLQTLLKVADIGSNYKVDKVLYDSCKPLIEGKCMMDMASETSTLTCLMNNIDGSDMTDDCAQRLIEVKYFIARDWTLDPELYNACHKEAVTRCSALDGWDTASNSQLTANVDPGPLVLSCLYRAGYDEKNPLSAPCVQNVRRVLRERASRVNLLPEVEESCREALVAYCSANIRPTEEMSCLQEQFEKKQFKDRYPNCYKQIFSFTQMESKDTKLNRLLTRSCRPVIEVYCAEVAEKDIDHGDVMQCLSKHKDASEMTNKCRSYVNHFELISLRDYHFSYRFTEACQSDIQQHCASQSQDKGAIIRCLSDIVFKNRVLGEAKNLRAECKKQLRVAYLEQEQVNFDDRSHMEDADPQLTASCRSDLNRLKCMQTQSIFEDVVECLRVDYNNLEPNCKAVVFAREEIEALDNTFDDELQKACKYDIGNFCQKQQGEKVLDCLMNTKIVRLLQRDCQIVVRERMIERVKDDRLNPGLLSACKKDAEHYCPDDYRKISDPRYAKQPLGGVIASCLRAKFSQFNNEIRLSPECKDEVSKVILESEFDIHADPLLYKACRFVINRHCSSTILQRGGNFDNVLECLKADIYKIQDADCSRQLARHTQESLVDIHLDPSLLEACSVDVQRVCRDTPSGQSRIILCLLDALQVHQVQITAECRNKLMERQKLWKIAHDQYKMALPQSWSDLYNTISNHPERSSILTWVGLIVFVLLIVGCVFGRWSKNTYSELKNR